MNELTSVQIACIVQAMKSFAFPANWEGDYKDAAAERSAHLDRVLHGHAIHAPDGYNCPRAFSAWLGAVYDRFEVEGLESLLPVDLSVPAVDPSWVEAEEAEPLPWYEADEYQI